MELPFHLKALPPEALDVLRYLGTLPDPVAHAIEISDSVGLSDRTFGKVIRRLVTKGYLQMAGDQEYRLTESGQDAVDELAEVEAANPASARPDRRASAPTITQVKRRMLLVAPRSLKAGQPNQVVVAFQPATQSVQRTDLVVRLTAVHAMPGRPQEDSLELDQQSAYLAFKITPDMVRRVRLRTQVYQIGPNPDDISVAGGFYVDLDVQPPGDETSAGLSAFGADLTLTQME